MISVLLLLIYKWLSQIDQYLIDFVVTALRAAGPMPKHIAFIMDGNRRYAKSHHRKSTDGYLLGYRTLESILTHSLQLGIHTVTVWALSIDNLRHRSQSEVQFLLDLAQDKLVELARHSEAVRTHRVRIRVVGDLDLVPERVRLKAREAMWLTRENNGALLNVCFAYTGRHDMYKTYTSLYHAVASRSPAPVHHLCDIDATLFGRSLSLGTCPPVDMIIRTSGEHRLSDFLSWEACATPCPIYCFRKPWPAFRFWDLVPVLAEYHVRNVKMRLFANHEPGDVDARPGNPRDTTCRKDMGPASPVATRRVSNHVSLS